MAITIYNTGNASVANGATTVTLVGAVSGVIYAGDLFCDPAQPLVPPQRIATDPVAGVFSLAVAWPGTTMTAAPYEVRLTPDGVRIQERTRQVLNALGTLVAADVPFTPPVGMVADDVQEAIEEVFAVADAAAPQVTTYTKTETDTLVATAAAGAATRGTVRAATTANITISTALNNGDALDGVTLATGDPVLVKNQSTTADNGVYVVGASPARAPQFDTYNEHPGALIVVQEGSTNADSFWYCTSNKGGTLGSTAVAFSQLTLTPADGSVTLAKLANLANATIIGRSTAGTGVPEAVTMTSLAALLAAANGIREKLTVNRTYYVDNTNGNDANLGLSAGAGNAFKTIQKAIDTAVTLDFNGFTVIIQIADGTYTGSTTVKAMTGQASISNLVIQGNSGTPANVVISTTSAACFIAEYGGQAIVKDLKVQTTTAGNGFYVGAGGRLQWQNIVFGACADAHIIAFRGGFAVCGGNYSIVGGAPRHLVAATRGLIEVAGKTITLTGTPAFSTAFVDANAADIQAYSNTWSGSATGKRYDASMDGTIQTFGAGATALPGNASGTTATGGQYA